MNDGDVDDQVNPNLEAMREAFRLRRAKLGLTIDQVAAASGLDRRQVLRIANGEVRGTMGDWWRLARAVQVPLADLVPFLDAPHRSTPRP